MATARKKSLVILGEFLHEGIETAISVLGYEIVKKKLHGVKPRTWLERAKFLRSLHESESLAGVILYLPTPVFLYASQASFAAAWSSILEELGKTRSIVFAFEDNLRGEFSCWDYESDSHLTEEQVKERIEDIRASEGYFDDWSSSDFRRAENLKLTLDQMRDATGRPDEVQAFLNRLFASGLEIAPFRRRADVTIRIEEFLEDIDGGVFLRIYVPNRRWQAEQLASFFRTFERYLREVEGRSFSIDNRKTAYGVLYLFRCTDDLAFEAGLEKAIERFDLFMQMCRDKSNDAGAILEKAGASESDSQYLVSKYAKEYQRLLLDMRHEFEHKTLLLRQSLESEVLEASAGSLPDISRGAPSVILSLIGNSGPVNLTIGDGNIVSRKIKGSQVRQVLNGGFLYSEEDEALLEIFEKFADRLEAVQLKSDLDQLKDDSSPSATKKTSRQRVAAFLLRSAAKIEEIGLEFGLRELTAYIGKLVGSG